MEQIRKTLTYQPKKPREFFVPFDKSYDKVIPMLVETAKSISSKASDYVIKNPAAHNMELSHENILRFKFGNENELHRIRMFALHQLCTKLKMPPMFFDYLSKNEKTKELSYMTVNRLLSYFQDDLFLRMHDGEIRGVLTPRYNCFDTDKILDVFTSCFEKNMFLKKEDIEVQGFVNNLERFHLRFTNAEPIKGIPDKDVQYGLQIDSSDVGKSSIRVRFMVYKQICTNGLSISYLNKELFYHSHIGRITPDEFQEGLRKSFILFPEIAAKATDIIKSAENYSIKGSGLIDFDKDDDKSKKARKNMGKLLGLGEDALKTIAQIANKSYRPTSWGYVNAITEYSQRYDFERRAELEELAGRVLMFSQFYFAA